MNPNQEFKEIIKLTHILKNPKYRLSTFGETKINYFFLSEIQGFKDRSRLREGFVIAEKPQIITPDLFKNRFEGFGKDAGQFAGWLSEKYGNSLQGLEYKFRNKSKSVHVEHSSLKILAERIDKRLLNEESYHSAIIQGPDNAWQISLLKFIIDECTASFTENIRELDEHGFFDTQEKRKTEQIKEIETLFHRAKKDRSAISHLGKKLHQYGLFKEFEDKFFSLMRD